MNFRILGKLYTNKHPQNLCGCLVLKEMAQRAYSAIAKHPERKQPPDGRDNPLEEIAHLHTIFEMRYVSKIAGQVPWSVAEKNREASSQRHKR